MRSRTTTPCVLVLLASLSLAMACSSLTADPPAPYTPSALGPGSRIADVQSPTSRTYKEAIANVNGVDVDVTSTVVSWIDTFDETRDGKSVGTVYVQDLGSQAPYSGISLYEPNYVPADLRAVPGDVLDLVGPYQELRSVGTAIFNPGTTLPQLAKPVATFRYEYPPSNPTVVALSDLDSTNYLKGRQWEGMLVTVQDVTVAAGATDTTTVCPTAADGGTSGCRVTYLMGQGDASIAISAAAITNELYDLRAWTYPAGTHFKSVTGIVTWFFSYHIAPRCPADLCTQEPCGTCEQ